MNNLVYHDLNASAPYDRMKEFALKHGIEFKGQNLPKRYRHGEMKACYKNSALMSFRHNLIYVEGYASASNCHHSTLHAWCINELGEVFDRTWPYTSLNTYYGVSIKREYI